MAENENMKSHWMFISTRNELIRADPDGLIVSLNIYDC